MLTGMLYSNVATSHVHKVHCAALCQWSCRRLLWVVGACRPVIHQRPDSWRRCSWAVHNMSHKDPCHSALQTVSILISFASRHSASTFLEQTSGLNSLLQSHILKLKSS